ncbi:MAG: tetratricopeptide repeat protein [Planctomycetota bacterium]|nr:tetratricopeptide repeat protein [Planctomycetota bacterium]
MILAPWMDVAALRRFQRAWRYDSEAVSILPEIVFLAHHLHRRDEAARYAVIAAECTELDPLLLRPLALQLSLQRQWQRALRLYEKAWQKQAPADGKPPDAATVLLEVEIGRIYFLTENFAKAAEFFARVREALRDPQLLSGNKTIHDAILGEPERTYQMLAEGFFQAGRYAEAVAMFGKANEVKPNEAWLSHQLARVAAKEGRTEVALQLLDVYFQAKSAAEDTAPYELLADLHKSQSKDEAEAQQKSRAALEKLLAADGSNTALLFFLAERHGQDGRWADAELLWNRLLDIQPTAAGYAGLAGVYLRQERYEELLRTLGAAVAQTGSFQPLEAFQKTLPDAQQRLADLLPVARRQLAGAAESQGKGVPLVAAWLAFHSQQFETAEAWFTNALPLTQPSQRDRLRLSWGLDLVLAKRYETAAAVFQQAIDDQVAEDSAGVYDFYLVRALSFAGQTEEALRVADKTAALHPTSPRLQALPGWVLYRAKRYAEAEPLYRALISAFDDNHENADVRDELREARLILSQICVQAGRRSEGEEWLEQVLDEFPEDSGASNDLAYLWSEQGRRLKRSLAMIQRAVDGEPDNVAYLDSLGWVYYQLGRCEEAVRHLERAAAGQHADGTILDHLGDAYLRNGNRNKALEAWRKSVDAFTPDGDDTKREETRNKIKNQEK